MNQENMEKNEAMKNSQHADEKTNDEVPEMPGKD